MSILAPLGSGNQVQQLLSPHRFSVEQYHSMIQTGVLAVDGRVELLEGVIVDKMPHNPPHDACVDLTQNAVANALPKGWRVRVQSAITTEDSEPEPDVAAVRGPARRYTNSHPKPQDIGLVVEVAESSLQEDRETKGRLYARCRIPVYWIVNLRDSQVEVYTQPRAGRKPAYRQRRDYVRHESVPVIIEGRQVGQVAVSDLLP
jgi:Uma2 family endonuclease